MIDKELDNLSKAAFPAGDTAFDAKYWDQMSGLLDQKKKKRGFIFWWGSGIAVLAFLTGVWALNNSEIETNASIAPTKAQALKQNSTTKINKLKHSFTTSSEEKENNNQQPRIEDVLTINRDEPKPTVSEKNEPSALDRPTEIVEANYISTSSTETSNAANLAKEPVVQKQVLPSQNDPFEVEIAPEKSQDSNPIMSNIENTEKISPIASLNADIPFLFSTEALYKMPPSEDLNEDKTEFGDEVKKENNWKLFVEPTFAYHHGIKKSTTSTNEQQLMYSPTEDVQLGVDLGVKNRGFIIAGGVHFNQLSGSVNYSRTFTEEQLENDISSRTIIGSIDSTLLKIPVIRVHSGSDIVFQSGTPEYEVDTNYVTVYDTTTTVNEIEKSESQDANYTLQYAYLPMYFSYEYDFKKLFVGAGLGFDFGFLLNQKGSFYDAETNQIISTDNSNLVNSATITYNLGGTIGYKLNSNISILFRPNFRQQIISPLKDETLRKSRFGGLLSLRYQF